MELVDFVEFIELKIEMCMVHGDGDNVIEARCTP